MNDFCPFLAELNYEVRQEEFVAKGVGPFSWKPKVRGVSFNNLKKPIYLASLGLGCS